MKSKISTLSFLLVSLMILGGNSTTFGQTKEEIEIRNLETFWTKLLDQADTTALSKIFTKDYVVNNVNGKISTINDIFEVIRKGKKFPPVERFIEKITFNHNLAIVMGKEVAHSEKKDENIAIERRFTNIWIKTKDGWKLAARQSTNFNSK